MSLAVAGLIGGLLMAKQLPDPIPLAIRKSVPYSIFYPDSSRLPSGYRLSQNVIHFAKADVVILMINYGSKSIVVSEQQPPDSSTINNFVAEHIPVHTTLPTALGQAEFGAYNSGNGLRTVISLPVPNGPWLIITAPPDAKRQTLIEIISSMVKS